MKRLLLCMFLVSIYSNCLFAKGLDSSNCVILRFHPTSTLAENHFPKGSKNSTLTRNELFQAQQLLEKCIIDLNIEQKIYSIDITKYKCQFFVAVSPKGEKVIWVNCFCRTLDMQWRSKPVYVMDGGQCFFNLMINLSKSRCYNLMINGEA